MDIDPVAFSAVIAAIYDAAIDPQLWTDALKRACHFVGGLRANLFWQDNLTAQVHTMHLFNDDPHFTRLYVEVYAPLNPCLPAVFAQAPGEVYAATDLVPLAELVETRFFKEWIAPQGIGDSLGVILEKDQRGMAFLAFEMSALVADAGAKQRASLLAPHFQRAVAIGRLFRSGATETALTETLDHISDAVFLLDGEGRVTFANEPARRMMADGSLLYANGDLLRAADIEADRALSVGWAAMADSTGGIGAQGVTVTLATRSDGCWIANVLPLTDGARRRAGQANHAVAAVFVRNSTSVQPTPLELLSKAHRLTASEIRVTEALLRIGGLDALSEALGISRATVKTHLNHIYRKCRVKNQSELIRLVAGMGPDGKQVRRQD